VSRSAREENLCASGQNVPLRPEQFSSILDRLPVRFDLSRSVTGLRREMTHSENRHYQTELSPQSSNNPSLYGTFLDTIRTLKRVPPNFQMLRNPLA
jgi:hypothetical protein